MEKNKINIDSLKTNHEEFIRNNKSNQINKILIVGGSGSGKTDSLFNLIIQKPNIDKIFLYAKNPHETKHKK